MCDDHSDAENTAFLARQALDRRRFNLMSAGVAAATVLPGCAAAADKNAVAMAIAERKVAVKTVDGTLDGLFVHPAKGRHPAVILWPDVAGLREAYFNLARKLAQAGYAVLAANQYYRSAPAPIFNAFSEWRTPEGQAKLEPMRAPLIPAAVGRDAAAIVGWLDAQKEVDTARGIGANGYCMTGSYTVRAAAAVPGRVKAAASFHGGGLADATPDSPHLLIAMTQAAFVFAIAQNDDARDPAAKDVLRKTCAEAGRPATVEVFPAQHGWCTPDSPVYDPAQQARAWDMMLAMFAKL
ncbi:MAG: dienelactone hydrolase family protein [Novosphingobium sp.]